MAEFFQQHLGRAHTIHVDALRGEQQLNGLEDMRLIVGNKYPDWFFLT
jgi:hypothetical protein